MTHEPTRNPSWADLLAEIRRLAREGYGVDDIAVKLSVKREHVRKYVIKDGPR